MVLLDKPCSPDKWVNLSFGSWALTIPIPAPNTIIIYVHALFHITNNLYSNLIASAQISPIIHGLRADRSVCTIEMNVWTKASLRLRLPCARVSQLPHQNQTVI